MRGRLFLLSASVVLATAMAIVAACTGEDPNISPSDEAGAGSDSPTNDAPGGGDAADGGGGGDGALPLLTCRVRAPTTPFLVRTTNPGESIDDNFLIVPAGTEDNVRVISVATLANDYEIATVKYNKSTPPEISGTRHIRTNGRLLSRTPMSTGGTALFAVDQLDGSVGQSLVAYELPNLGGNDLPADPTPIALTNLGDVQDVGGRMIELTGSYYYVVSEKLDASSYVLASGKGPGGADAAPIFSSPDRPHLDGLTIFHGKDRVYAVIDVGEGPSAQTIAYHLLENGSPTSPLQQTQLTFPGGAPAFLLAGFPSTTAGKVDLFFGSVDQDAAAPSFLTLYGGQASDFTAGGSLVVEPPAFGGGGALNQLRATEVPLGNGGSGAAAGDSLALIGAGILSPDPDAGPQGLNFVMIDSEGRMRAKNAGPGNGFFADRLARMGNVSLAFAVEIGNFKIFHLGWTEHVTVDGATHDEVYVSRIECFNP